jgi:hypothetical protein
VKHKNQQATSPRNSDDSTDFSDVAVVTVATGSYLHRVRALFESVRELMPGALQVVCCLDSVADKLDLSDEAFEVIEARDLGLPRYDQLMLAFNPMAACCALKPHIALHALEYDHIQRVIYLDNDVGLYQKPEEMLELLLRHSFVVTPHNFEPFPNDITLDESMQVKTGVYNAGIFGVSKVVEGIRFLKWWANWMLDPRHVNDKYFYDQIWLNYVPAYCQEACVLRNPGYNVAYWNLAERDLHRVDGSFFCGDHPLVAFHFGSFDDDEPNRLIPKALSRFFFDEDNYGNEATRLLCVETAERWKNHGGDQCKQWDYQYRTWSDGVVVRDSERFFVENKWDIIPPNLDMWAANLQKQEPQLFCEMRKEWLHEQKNLRKPMRRHIIKLLDFSLRDVLHGCRKLR